MGKIRIFSNNINSIRNMRINKLKKMKLKIDK
jgi:hypothetical protein